jgi:hypothetical protein
MVARSSSSRLEPEEQNEPNPWVGCTFDVGLQLVVSRRAERCCARVSSSVRTAETRSVRPTEPYSSDPPVNTATYHGRGGRDFHLHNTVFRDDPAVEVVAFTATQIPGIDDRVYPPSLAGRRYPDGIPIRPEAELEDLVAEHDVDRGGARLLGPVPRGRDAHRLAGAGRRGRLPARRPRRLDAAQPRAGRRRLRGADRLRQEPDLARVGSCCSTRGCGRC